MPPGTYPFHTFHTGSFGGQTCAQYWTDFLLWEMVLNSNPQLQAIVELGTWEGGFSWYLWAQSQARGMRSFKTYDVVKPQREPPGFERLDIYRHAEVVAVHLASLDCPTVLLCDGGNKPRELKTFPPYLSADSIVVVHDWGTETLAADVPDFLEELYGDLCDQLGSISRVFRMKP